MKNVINLANEYAGVIIVLMLFVFEVINLFLKIFYKNKIIRILDGIRSLNSLVASNTSELHSIRCFGFEINKALDKLITIKNKYNNIEEIDKQLTNWIRSELNPYESLSLRDVLDKLYELLEES